MKTAMTELNKNINDILMSELKQMERMINNPEYDDFTLERGVEQAYGFILATSAFNDECYFDAITDMWERWRSHMLWGTSFEYHFSFTDEEEEE